MTGVGWLLCRLGRHDREYLIGHNDLVVVWCPRRQNPKVAEVFDAKRLPEKDPWEWPLQSPPAARCWPTAGSIPTRR